MDNVIKVKAGWVKRLPDVVLGPFATKAEAENAYKTLEKVKKEKVEKVEKVSEPKKVEDAFKVSV